MKRIFIKPDHYRTGCTNDYPDEPSLYDRLEYTLNLIDEGQVILHTSHPKEILKKHISIECLHCQHCHDESEYENLPVIAYTRWFLLVLNDDEDWGTSVSVYKMKQVDDCSYLPMIYEKGANFLLPNDNPQNKRKDIEIK